MTATQEKFEDIAFQVYGGNLDTEAAAVECQRITDKQLNDFVKFLNNSGYDVRELHKEFLMHRMHGLSE